MSRKIIHTHPIPLAIEYCSISALDPNPKNARRHTTKQVAKLGRAIQAFGWTAPAVIDEAGLILAGHARYAAAKQLGLDQLPCIRLTGLSPAQKTAFSLADNKIGDDSHFDDEALRQLLAELSVDVDFNMELTGFDTAEIDFRLDGPAGGGVADPADRGAEPDLARPAVTQVGDLWLLGEHRLLCGNALEAEDYVTLMGGDRAQMVFTDPPYNVPVRGHVSGLGAAKHREFAMASGELSCGQFQEFLTQSLTQLARFSSDGSIHFICMDWRHIRPLLAAGEGVYTELKNICVWSKTNAGMGSLYRSQHELVPVFKNGTAPHQNNVELGKNGRYRTNVWDYPGANAFSATRDADLAAHPTVKPVALVADAIRDCSKRGAIILDPFVGSGTTILAADRTGRRAAAMEIDPLYVDTAIGRWQTLTGKTAVLAGDGRTFAAVESERLGRPEDTAVLMQEAG
jgi:DNA modification methylase